MVYILVSDMDYFIKKAELHHGGFLSFFGLGLKYLGEDIEIIDTQCMTFHGVMT